MSSENSVIIKNSGILLFRLVFISIMGLITSSIIIRCLGASDFGLYSVVGGVVVMMAFLNTVMTATTYRYIAFELGKGDRKGVNRVFNVSLVIHLFLALLAFMLTETAGVYYVNHHLNVPEGKIEDAIFLMRFSMYAMIVSIASVPFMGFVTALEKFKIQAGIEIIRSILGFLIAIIIFFSMGNRLRIYAVLVFIANAIPSILFFLYCNRAHGDVVKWNFQRSKSEYKEMIGFSGWIMLGAAASVGQTSGAALIVNAFFGTVSNAAFGIANQINTMVVMFSRNLGQAAIPQIIKSFSSGDTERTVRLAAYVSKYTFFLLLLPSIPLLLETDFLLSLWLGQSVPPYTATFCQLMIVNAMIGGLGGGLPALIQATGKIKYFQIILSTTSLLSLPAAYLLFQAGYPPPTILAAFIFTALINVVVWQILLKKIIDFNVYFFIKTTYSKVFYVTVLSVPIFFLKSKFEAGLERFVGISTLAVCFLLISIYLVGLEHKEKEIFKGILLNIIGRKRIIHG